MAAMRGSRLPVGSSAWIAEERSSALNVAQSEVEEFSFSVRNEFEWLNEHMADVFNENEINVAEIFKTPGKLRGKTPRTVRKGNNTEARVPLSDIFSSTPKAAPNPFTQQLNRIQTPKLKITELRSTPVAVKAATPHKPLPSPKPLVSRDAIAATDSGYHGSQPNDVMEIDAPASPAKSLRKGQDHIAFHAITMPNQPQSPTITRTIHSPEMTFQTAKEDQTTRVVKDLTHKLVSPGPAQSPAQSPAKEVPASPITSPGPCFAKQPSPAKSSPLKSSPAKQIMPEVEERTVPETAVEHGAEIHDNSEAHMDDSRSPSDGSSPIRPVVRKSSLNFASLPAREPLNTTKGNGARVSRTSHLDNNRASYYSRHTGGKSLGANIQIHQESDDDEDDHDEMDVDEATVTQHDAHSVENFAMNHNKTYTQRLQDQINLLGKSQPNAARPSKSTANIAPVQQVSNAVSQPVEERKPMSPTRKPVPASTSAPGAFPEDDEDDWVAPPAVPQKGGSVFSPRPAIPKSYSADIMEGIRGNETVSGAEFILPKQRQPGSRPGSPQRAPTVPERTTSALSHSKSASVSILPEYGLRQIDEHGPSPKKGISVSNPTLNSVSGTIRPETPSKSPSRSFRDSPLKQVKNKLSSILKSSKGLLASSAAISAEGKSLMSPSMTRLGFHAGPSTDSIVQQPASFEPLYPDLSKRAATDNQSISTISPPRPAGRRTRASAEREKEEKRKEKEARLMAGQIDKLEKAREKEREKARVFSKEQEKMAALEKQMASHKEQEKVAPVATVKETPKPTRTSPRKAKAQLEAEAEAKAAAAAVSQTDTMDDDIEMADAGATMPPPSVPRSAGPSQATRGREPKRPIKPTKEASTKSKQAPTLIRVNTSSQHSQYHPSNSVLAAGLHDTLGSANAVPQLKSKASHASLQTKPSLQSLKSSVSSNGRPKALELAARRKEQEEKETQRKREVKLEMERKRAALQEEERKADQQRRQEAERLREKEREQVALQAEVKKNAQKQAAIERAKQTRAPPPPVRSQPNGPPDYVVGHDKANPGTSAPRVDAPASRPPSRMNSTAHRPQEDHNRPVNALLSNTAKAAPKRAHPQDGNDDASSRNPQARNGPTYQAKDAKRRRTSDDFADELDMESQPPNIKGPPVRPSGGFKKDLPTKSMFPSGYTTVPQSATRDLFKATVTAQHNSTVKATQPMDMAQFSKGAIPFAPNPNAAGTTHKTPARPAGATNAKSAAKSATRSSPRFQNGESIELPEIQTDDEDEDEDDGHLGVAPWADSPDLRRALVRQETMDPSQIFGPPAPLIMEEVFSKSKDRWHKFRARTSSANWSGSDRLTEDEIRKDLAARDKMRRDGGWSYDMSKDLA